MTTDMLSIVPVGPSKAEPAQSATPVPKELPASATPPAVKPVQHALAAVAQQIESYLRSVGRSLQFQVDETTGETIVQVRDSETGELIRQIPGEETIRLARALGNQPNALIDLIV